MPPFKNEKTALEWMEVTTSIFRGFLSMISSFNQHTESLLLERLEEENAVSEKALTGLPQVEQTKIISMLKSIPERAATEEWNKNVLDDISLDGAKVALAKIKILSGMLAYKDFLHQMTLTYLISFFENHLSRVAEIVIKSRPQIMFASDKEMTFGEIMKFTQLEELRHSMIE